MSLNRHDMTVGQASNYLNVSQRTIRRMIRMGALKAINYGGRAGYRIPIEEAERFRKERVA